MRPFRATGFVSLLEIVGLAVLTLATLEGPFSRRREDRAVVDGSADVLAVRRAPASAAYRSPGTRRQSFMTPDMIRV
jgi:hypothetical protein